MTTLKSWLDAQRGRASGLAEHLGVSRGRVTQMADHGVPNKFMLAVRDFTEGEVSLESMVSQHTTPAITQAADV